MPAARPASVLRATLPLLAAAVLLAGCAATPSATVAADQQAVLPMPSEGVPFTVLGDSNTAANRGSLADGLEAGESWAYFAAQPGLRLLGGYAHNGDTTLDIAARAQPVDAEFLLVMAGTNDLSRGVPRTRTRAALLEAVSTVGADRVVLVAVPPRGGGRGPETQQLLDWQRLLAAEQGWTVLDPWTWTRAGDGSWSDPDCAADDLHGTPAAYERVGLVVAEELSRLAGIAATGRDPLSVDC